MIQSNYFIKDLKHLAAKQLKFRYYNCHFLK